MPITSNRRKFLGVHVTPEVKDALEKEAAKEQTSVSMLTYRFLLGKLREKGHAIPDEQFRKVLKPLENAGH